MTETKWWRDAVIYQIYPRSFVDSNGDGYGDLPGIISRLEYLSDLGVDAIWLSPFYLSPMADAGYDVADYFTVDPLFGDTGDADSLIAKAHELGLKVIFDLVPNHTSDEHNWFQAAKKAGPGSNEREFYLFRDGNGENGELPPNNWRSVLGDKAWTRLIGQDGSPEQWYLHLFDVKQPDLNWDNPKVRRAFEEILRHWLTKGVDGFRVDVAHSLVKAPGLPDDDSEQRLLHGQLGPAWDQEGVHDIYRSWRKVLDEYDGDRALVAEAWIPDTNRLARYIRPDEMNQAFNFDFLTCEWNASAYRKVITSSILANTAVGAPTTWVLSNHDVVRHSSRLARESENPIDGYGVNDLQPDNKLGLQRAKAATLMMLALPGSAYLYQGEELGLPEYGELPDEFRQDPVWFRTKHAKVGRDGCRVPMPWDSTKPALGFSPTGKSWLPQPAEYQQLALNNQLKSAASTWQMYRRALSLRAKFKLGQGSLTWLDTDAHILGFQNGHVQVLVNIAGAEIPLPKGQRIILASNELKDVLPTDNTCWLLAE